MTVQQGCIILTAAVVAGVLAGYLLGRRPNTADIIDAFDRDTTGFPRRGQLTRSRYMAAGDEYEAGLEELLRKGGPPTPEATSTTDTPDTTDASADS